MSPRPIVEFDAAQHVYTHTPTGERWPSVTQALECVGLSDFSMVTEHFLVKAQERGTRVHQAAWYDDQGDLDESTIAPEEMGYIEAWRKFRRDQIDEIESIEQIVSCSVFRYCGTYNRIARLKSGIRACIDLKDGYRTASWRYQIALYARCHPKPHSLHRIAVQLHDDGEYAMHHYPPSTFRHDESIGLSAVNLWWAKAEDGLILSVTKHLVCTDCKQYLWIGQAVHLYMTETYIDAMAQFLLIDHHSTQGTYTTYFPSMNMNLVMDFLKAALKCQWSLAPRQNGLI